MFWFKKEEEDTYKYHLIHKGKIVHRGVTYDLDRREVEHQETWLGAWIKQVGRKTTRKEAVKWLNNQPERR